MIKTVKIAECKLSIIISQSVFGITGPVCEARPRARFSRQSLCSSLHYTQHTSIYACLMSRKRMKMFGARLKHCNKNYVLAFHCLCSELRKRQMASSLGITMRGWDRTCFSRRSRRRRRASSMATSSRRLLGFTIPRITIIHVNVGGRAAAAAAGPRDPRGPF